MLAESIKAPHAKGSAATIKLWRSTPLFFAGLVGRPAATTQSLCLLTLSIGLALLCSPLDPHHDKYRRNSCSGRVVAAHDVCCALCERFK
jgi:hypothetical protein